MLIAKVSEVQSAAAIKQLVERLRLEETITGERVSIDPKPSAYKFACALAESEPSEDVLYVAMRVRRAQQYSTRSKLNQALRRCAGVASNMEQFRWLINHLGIDLLTHCREDMLRAWLEQATTVEACVIHYLARNPTTSDSDFLLALSKAANGYNFVDYIRDACRNFILSRNSGDDFRRAVARILAGHVSRMAQDGCLDPSLLRKLPRSVDGNRLLVRLPDGERDSLEGILNQLG